MCKKRQLAVTLQLLLRLVLLHPLLWLLQCRLLPCLAPLLLALTEALHHVHRQGKGWVDGLQAWAPHQGQPCNAKECVVDVHLVLRPV